MTEQFLGKEFRPETKAELEEIAEAIELKSLVVTDKATPVIDLLSLIEDQVFEEDQGNFEFTLDPTDDRSVRYAYRRVGALLVSLDVVDDLLEHVEIQEDDREELGSEFKPAVKDDHEEARVKLNQLRALISSFIELFRDNDFFDEFDQDQLERDGLLEKIQEHGYQVASEEDFLDRVENEIGDLVVKAQDYSDKLNAITDPGDPDYLNPEVEIVPLRSGVNGNIIDYFHQEIEHYRQLFGASSLRMNLEETARVQSLENDQLSRAVQVLARLRERQEEIRRAALENWRQTDPDYSALLDMISLYEASPPPVALDGSVDVAQEAEDFQTIMQTARTAAETSAFWAANQLAFERDFSSAEKVLAKLELALYLFALQPFITELQLIESLTDEEVQDLGTGGKRERAAELQESRKSGGSDMLSLEFFAVNIGDVYGSSDATETLIQKRIQSFQERYQAALQKLEIAELSSAAAEKFRGMRLMDLLQNWFTMDIVANDEIRYALEQILGEKILAYKKKIFDQGQANDEEQEDIERRFRNFSDLVWQVFALTDYGVLRADAINTLQGTARHEEVLAATNKDGCMTWNEKFNNNPLVGAIDVHPGEMETEDPDKMGVVQMIVFAAYQQMKKPGKEGQYFSRNQGFTSETMNKLIDHVCDQEAVEMHDGTQRDEFNIKEELKKFANEPELDENGKRKEEAEIRQFIKKIARWKIARDDAASKAGIYILGRYKGAFKYVDGASGKPAGVMASACYAVGKNERFDNHLSILQFISPENTGLVETDPNVPDPLDPNRPLQHPNDPVIMAHMEETDRFNVFTYPWLVGPIYQEQGDRIVGQHKYAPKDWWKDFPALDEFWNQNEKSLTGPDYIKARDAILKIMELASRAHLINLSSDFAQAREKVSVNVQQFATEIGKALAYISPYNTGIAPFDKFGPEVNKYNYANELILAAFKHYLTHLLMAVKPVGGKVNFFDVQVQYEARFELVRETIIDAINANSTLAPFYQVELTGKGVGGHGYLHDIPTMVWRDNAKLKNQFQSWQLENVPRYANAGTFETLEIVNGSPKHPVNQSGEWSSSYEDAAFERTG